MLPFWTRIGGRRPGVPTAFMHALLLHTSGLALATRPPVHAAAIALTMRPAFDLESTALLPPPAMRHAHARSVVCRMYEDFRPDPAWQRDSILLLCYCGVEDLFRSAATGVKSQIGFDFLQLNVELCSAILVAGCWLLAAQLTGVTEVGFRYKFSRVLVTWALAALPALVLRQMLFRGFLVGDPIATYTDAIATLALMVGLRLAEEQGYV